MLLEMKKRGEKIAMLTAYDYTMARIIDSDFDDLVAALCTLLVIALATTLWRW